MAERPPTSSTPIIWIMLASLIIWAGAIALILFIVWLGQKQTTLRDPRRQFVAPIERMVLA